jgi:type 1 glutamine amidotransferase
MGVALLVYTRTGGYRHESIPAGIATLRELGAAHGFTVTATEEPDVFAAAELPGFAAVVFLSTSGTVLPAQEQRAGMAAYLRGGGGFVGIHGAAASTEPDWPFYGELVGARFAGHPKVQPGLIRVADGAHPATAHLGATWERTDEWYNFRSNPRPRTHVLLTVDESSYEGGTLGADHPIAWCHRNCGGPAFITTLGHPVAGFAEPAFRDHLLGGIRYATGGSGPGGDRR